MSARSPDSPVKAGFASLVDPRTRLLILGSLPGEASLAAQQYYANPRNQFWSLIGSLIGQEELATLPYDQRLAALAARGIGLWDVFTSAARTGSLDSAIRAAASAPLADLAARLPALQAIAFNGRLAAKAGRIALGTTHLALIDLPSSSPAHAAIRFAAKLDEWSRLKQFLI
jgi:TDG/mug DNA glycosylase family protein